MTSSVHVIWVLNGLTPNQPCFKTSKKSSYTCFDETILVCSSCWFLVSVQGSYFWWKIKQKLISDIKVIMKVQRNLCLKQSDMELWSNKRRESDVRDLKHKKQFLVWFKGKATSNYNHRLQERLNKQEYIKKQLKKGIWFEFDCSQGRTIWIIKVKTPVVSMLKPPHKEN